MNRVQLEKALALMNEHGDGTARDASDGALVLCDREPAGQRGGVRYKRKFQVNHKGEVRVLR